MTKKLVALFQNCSDFIFFLKKIEIEISGCNNFYQSKPIKELL